MDSRTWEKLGNAISSLNLQPREKFLILEITKGGTSALLLSVDKEKKISLEKTWDDFSYDKLKSRQRGVLRTNVIVSVAPEFLYVKTLPVEFVRDASAHDRPISLEELENILAREIGRLFNTERNNASVHLDVDDLDAVLVNSKITDFKVDNHTVMNPVGFSGKSVKGVLELTFTARPIFQNLKEFFNAKDGFFFTGAHLSGLRVLGRVEKLPAQVVFIGDKGASYLILDKAAWGNAVYGGDMEWRMESLWEAIEEGLGVDHSVAMKLYDMFLKGDASENFLRSFYRIVKPVVDDLAGRVKKTRLKGKIFAHSPVSFPQQASRALRRAAFHDLTPEQLLERSGFSADIGRWPIPPRSVFMRLAPFFEYYYDRSGSEINNRLRRRLHWLIQE